MKIKTKLSIEFTLIVVGILLFFSALVYYFSYTSQHSRFADNLTKRAKNTAILLINVPEVDSVLLKKIQQSTFNWMEEEIVVTDSELKILYSNNIEYLTDEVINQNSIKGDNYRFSISQKDGICYKHVFKNQTYTVMVMAYDKNRKENLSELLKILLWSIAFSTWLSVILSYLFAKNAIQPISQIIKSVKEINSSRLSNRLHEGNKKDEIAQLALTFNQLLSNLEIAFKNQEDFVANASHELRTPLSVMIVESDYILSREQNPEEYKKHIASMVIDLKKLNAQLTSLLELAQINQDNSIQLSAIRIDEIVFNAIQQMKAKYTDRKIIPVIQFPEYENELLVNGNAGMLVVAFQNLIENACKFSTDDVIIEFDVKSNYIEINISDKGIGIPPNEIEGIYKPFSRASNVRFKSGFGIGLSLVAKIFELHDVEFKVHSTENKGTRFELFFKSVNLKEEA
jgi:signal transduction histidine kinase